MVAAMKCHNDTGTCMQRPKCEHACNVRGSWQAPLAPVTVNNQPCRLCRHWEPRYPKNPALGACLRVSTILFESHGEEPGAIALSIPGGMREFNPPTREAEFPILRTVAEFGCVGWESR